MYAQQLGFASSWRMLTRDKGWIKPMLVLTVVGWIPILGQVAIFGYALEWARLTAWGVDAAPKQRGVDVPKVLRTGGIAFAISVLMSLAATAVGAVLFGSWATAFALPMGSGLMAMIYTGIMSGVGALGSLGALVVGLLLEAFIMAAMLRATIYDGFGAAWRIDRICQMVARDPGGFLHVYAVSLIGGLINWAYSALISLIGTAVMAFGAVGIGFALDRGVERMVLGTAPGMIMVAVICAIALLFAGSVIATVMQLLAVNAMGQWFCRFRVDLWGVSSAPLPDGVPVTASASAGAGERGSAPCRPQPVETPGAGAPWTACGQAAAGGAPAGAQGACGAGADAGVSTGIGTASASGPAADAAAVADPATGAEPCAAAPRPAASGQDGPRSADAPAPDGEAASPRGPILLGPVSDPACGDADGEGGDAPLPGPDGRASERAAVADAPHPAEAGGCADAGPDREETEPGA